MAISNTRRFNLSILVGVASCALTACGGGGGNQTLASTGPSLAGVAPTPPPSQPATPSLPPASGGAVSSVTPDGPAIIAIDEQSQRSVADDEEYRANYNSAEYVNALFALDNGWTGQGVLVGVLDNGVNATGELAGQVSTTLSRDFGYIENGGQRTFRSGNDRIGDETSNHGTPVASIIAARNDGVGVQGLAPDATIVSLRTDAVRNGDVVWGIGRDQALRHAADNNIPLVNMSLARRPGTSASQSFMDALAYYNTREQGLLVAAAGNNSASTSGSAVEFDSRYGESWLFVAALENDGEGFELASYSNRCGTVQSRCVVAPAINFTQNIDGGFSNFSGTSGATPVVTSVAALILSKWPQLSGVDAGNIILNTARDLGAPGVDSIYGHGLVDAEAALRPANPTLSNGQTTASIDQTVMVVGSAFGLNGNDSITGALNDVTVLDDYGRDYSGDITSLVVGAGEQNQGWLPRRIEAQANARIAGFSTKEGSASLGITGFDTGLLDTDGQPLIRHEISHAQFSIRIDEKTSILGGLNTGDNVSDDILGLAPTSDVLLSYSPLAETSVGVMRHIGRNAVTFSVHSGNQAEIGVSGASLQVERGNSSLKLGVIDEQGSVFGAPVGLGILRFGDGAQTYFLEASSGVDLGAFDLQGFASIGGTRLRLSGDTLLTGAGTITSGRFGLIASRDIGKGQFSLGIGQELVVLSGNATLSVSEGFDSATRSLIFTDRRLDLSGDLAPQLTMGYELQGQRSSLRIGAASDVDARDVRALATWSVRLGQ